MAYINAADAVKVDRMVRRSGRRCASLLLPLSGMGAPSAALIVVKG